MTGLIFFGTYQYDPTSAYCWIRVSNETYKRLDLYLAMILLIFPMLPIITTTIITAHYVRISDRQVAQGKFSKAKRKATVTVIIFTCVYVLCNTPVMVSMVRFSILTFTGWVKDILGPLGTPMFTVWYIWPMTFVILVQLNAGLNPFIYLLRMVEFRKGVTKESGVARMMVKFNESTQPVMSNELCQVIENRQFSHNNPPPLPQRARLRAGKSRCPRTLRSNADRDVIRLPTYDVTDIDELLNQVQDQAQDEPTLTKISRNVKISQSRGETCMNGIPAFDEKLVIAEDTLILDKLFEELDLQ